MKENSFLLNQKSFQNQNHSLLREAPSMKWKKEHLTKTLNQEGLEQEQ